MRPSILSALARRLWRITLQSGLPSASRPLHHRATEAPRVGVHNWPTISIVTPSYNQAQFLEQCIASVYEQNYPHLEYIVIDGESTDGSIDIIRRHAARLTHWVSEPDAGQSHALNKGFRMAKGELVAWLNADDFYLPGALAAVATAYCENPTAPFYFGDGLRVDESGRPLSGFVPGGVPAFNRTALILGLNYICQPATFIKRQHLEAVQYLDETLHYGLDTDLWIRLSEIAPAFPVARQLAATREYAATKTATGSFERIEELRKIAARHSGLPMTPGILCYFLDTLHRFAAQNEATYPRSFTRSLEGLWAAAATLMAPFGAGPDGFPTAGDRGEREE